MRRVLIIMVALVLGVMAWPAGAETKTVEMQDNVFAPVELTAKVGDIINFKNTGQAPHTATLEGVFDTGNVDAGQTKEVKLDKPGTFEYVCIYHLSVDMKGTITVSGEGGAAPPAGGAAAPAGGAAAPAGPSPTAQDPPTPPSTEEGAPQATGSNPVSRWWSLTQKQPIGLRLFAPLALVLLLAFAGMVVLGYLKNVRKVARQE